MISELDSAARRSFSRPAASTISGGAPPASPVTIAVRPSRETVTVCCGGSTPLTLRSLRSTRVTLGERGSHRPIVDPGALPATTTDSA